MAKTGTASLTIAELREFASFTESEQLFIERGLDIAFARGDAFKTWGHDGDGAAIRSQYLAYRELRTLRDKVPCETTMDGLEAFMGPLMRVTAQDLARSSGSRASRPIASWTNGCSAQRRARGCRPHSAARRRCRRSALAAARCCSSR